MLFRSSACRSFFVLGLFASAGLAQAIDQPTTKPASKTAAPLPAAKPAPAVDPVQFAATSVTRAIMIDLRLRKEAKPDDFRLAMHLLSIAEAIDPTNAEYPRRRVEAAWSAGDTDQAIASTRTVVRLDPADTVAQLRLISTMISEKQTVDERLAMQSKFLTGPSAAKLDPAVRSRIAVDAALLTKEHGDEKSFAEFLKQAVTLDPSNKEAALLALNYYAQKGTTEPLGRLDLISNLLMADPLDPNVLRQLSAELVSLGAYKQAHRFYDNSVHALEASGQAVWSSAEVERVVLEWHEKGVNTAINLLNDQLAFKRQQTERIARAQEKVGALDIPSAADVRLDFETDRTRAVAGWAAEDAKTLGDAITDMAKSAAYRREIISNDSKRPPSISREEAKRQADHSFIQVNLWRALFSVDIEKIDADLADLKEIDEENVPRSQAVTLVRDAIAKPDQASEPLAKLHKLADTDELLVAVADCASAIVSMKLNKDAQARDTFTDLARRFSFTDLGAGARTLAIRLGQKDQILSPVAAQAAKHADAIPAWVDRAGEQPRFIMQLSAAAESKAQHLVPQVVTVSVRNTCTVPLAVGPDRPINSRMLFGPDFSVRWKNAAQAVQPEVVDAARRLRLMPGEEMRVRCYPEIGTVGLLDQICCGEEVRTTWRVLQGFVQGGVQALLEGPGCLAAEARPVVRSPLPESAWAIPDLMDQIEQFSDDNLPQITAISNRIFWSEALGIPAKEVDEAREKAAAESRAAVRTQIVQALAKAFPSLSLNARLTLVSALPHAGQVPEMAAFDQVIRADKDPRVIALVLATRVTDPKDALLDTAEGSSDPMLVGIAKIVRDRAANNTPCYARLGPGLAALRGTSDAAKASADPFAKPADGESTKATDKPADKATGKPADKPVDKPAADKTLKSSTADDKSKPNSSTTLAPQK